MKTRVVLTLAGLCTFVVASGTGCHTHRGAANVERMDYSSGHAVRTTSVPFEPEGTVLSLAPLTDTPDPTAYAGRRVQCSASVRRVLDPHTILVENQPGKPVCVHLQLAERGVRAGDMVAFDGTVKHLSETARAVVGLSDRASTAISDQTIFIDAQELRIVR